jgi:glycine/D-amino acid oxidase-like deaminating enzyme
MPGLTMAETSDVLVIGGGVVGAALAFGMAGLGASIRLLDGADADLRAARANFGLVWVQSKGHDMPAYARWTRRSADLWPGFAAELRERSGLDVQHRQTGGLSFCLDEDALRRKRDAFARLHNQRHPWSADVEILDRPALERLLPGVRLGSKVAGASFCPQDGEANPLMLLRALHDALRRQGIDVRAGAPATSITREGGVFRILTAAGVFEAPRVILAAGHGSTALARQVGIAAPMRPERGQILVTERLQLFLPFAGDTIRQTADGTVMIGATHEDADFDTGTTADAGAALARHATDVFPALAQAGVTRAWAGLRVLTPDGSPLYAESGSNPGAALVTCHSGVTLAAAHARELAPALLAGRLGPEFAAFGPERFGGADVPEAA